MRKAIIFLLGLLVLLYVGKRYLDGERAGAAPAESSAAKRRLDNVREKRRDIEQKQDERLDEALRGSEAK